MLNGKVLLIYVTHTLTVCGYSLITKVVPFIYLFIYLYFADTLSQIILRRIVGCVKKKLEEAVVAYFRYFAALAWRN
jgi:hypothetical protein